VFSRHGRQRLPRRESSSVKFAAVRLEGPRSPYRIKDSLPVVLIFLTLAMLLSPQLMLCPPPLLVLAIDPIARPRPRPRLELRLVRHAIPTWSLFEIALSGSCCRLPLLLLYLSLMTDQSLYPDINIPLACLESSLLIPLDLQ